MSMKDQHTKGPKESAPERSRSKPGARIIVSMPVPKQRLRDLAQVEAETESGLPDFVKDEFDAFLECGILAHGFLRLRCVDCTHEKLVAFSCKRRGFCPSCGGRRMAQAAAHLVDHT